MRAISSLLVFPSVILLACCFCRSHGAGLYTSRLLHACYTNHSICVDNRKCNYLHIPLSLVDDLPPLLFFSTTMATTSSFAGLDAFGRHLVLGLLGCWMASFPFLLSVAALVGFGRFATWWSRNYVLQEFSRS